MSTITVPAGAQVTANFDNQDSGIQHNVAFYTDSSASNTIYKVEGLLDKVTIIRYLIGIILLSILIYLIHPAVALSLILTASAYYLAMSAIFYTRLALC